MAYEILLLLPSSTGSTVLEYSIWYSCLKNVAYCTNASRGFSAISKLIMTHGTDCIEVLSIWISAGKPKAVDIIVTEFGTHDFLEASWCGCDSAFRQSHVKFTGLEGVVRFYGATLCISAVLAVGRRLSVCLSVMVMYCTQTAKDITYFRPGRLIILVFEPKHRYTIPSGIPTAWVQKNRNFRPISRCIVETVQDRSMVAIEC